MTRLELPSTLLPRCLNQDAGPYFPAERMDLELPNGRRSLVDLPIVVATTLARPPSLRYRPPGLWLLVCHRRILPIMRNEPLPVEHSTCWKREGLQSPSAPLMVVDWRLQQASRSQRLPTLVGLNSGLPKPMESCQPAIKQFHDITKQHPLDAYRPLPQSLPTN